MVRDDKRPTDGELEILRVLWRLGPTTVRGVYEELSRKRTIGLTTVLKLMQIMAEKGYVTRDESVRPQIFRPVRAQHATQRQLLADLLHRAFNGSPGNLVLQALSSEETTAEERRAIRDLLDELEEKQK